MKFSSIIMGARTIHADVVVVGGGWAGLVCAYLLSEAGKKVVVIERDGIGGGATSRTTAFLTQLIDTSYSDLERVYGHSVANVIAEGSEYAIHQIEQLSHKEQVPAAFLRCDGYLLAYTRDEAEALRKEVQALKRVGIPSTFSPTAEFDARCTGCLTVPNQGRFDASTALPGLAELLHANGVTILERCEAKGVEETEEGIEVHCEGVRVVAKDLVAATYLPWNKPKALAFRIAVYNSYVLEAEIPKGIFPPAIYMDMHNPYHYFRVDAGETIDLLTLGGEDHRADIPLPTHRSFAALEEYTKTFMNGAPYTIRRRWVGPIAETIDRLPYMGEYAPHQYVLTGFSGNGMTYAWIGAKICCDGILGVENPWAETFRPGRTPKLKRLGYAGVVYMNELYNGVIRNLLRRGD